FADPFTITHPTAVQTSLVAGASFARFDPSGRYVAAGRGDGSAAIWDLDTRSAVRWLEGHVKGVTSVDWSRYSRYVLTSSKDWNIIVWDLLSDVDPIQRHCTIRFDAPVVSAFFHPRNSQIVLALLGTGEAYLVDSRKEYRSRMELCEVQEESEDEGEGQSSRTRSAMTVARFDPTGKHIFIGTSSGSVLVFNTRTKSMVARHKVSGAGAMKGFDFAKSGRRLVTNSSDRTLRQFNLPIYPPPNADREYIEQELEPTHRFNDPINKTAWYAMSYSSDGEWLAGGAADPATHKIYIWDMQNDGQFATALDGGREPLLHVHWHPFKSSIASTTNQGNILIWHCPTPERWGAFAGGFEEVDENVEYEEKEDEFDIEDESEIQQRKMKREEEAVDIDGVDDTAETHPEPNGHIIQPITIGSNEVSETDEDALWADEEADDDIHGWKMKVVVGLDDDDV
ncbi:hypothetical protein PILCRDRAFT_68653, partial [Piloderma croceum F 1598]